MITYSSRSDVPESEKWKLEDIYPTQEEWEADIERIGERTEVLKKYDGAIHNGHTLLAYLTESEKVSFMFNKVSAYAMLLVDIDTRDTFAQSLQDRAKQLGVKLNGATSFFMPFLLSLEESTLQKYIAEEEGLKYFEKQLLDAYRYKAHVLTKEKEEVLSQLGEAFSSPSHTYGMINNADIKFGKVTNEEGNKVELTRGMYSKLIEHKDRSKRKEAYKAYYQPYVHLKNSIASTLGAAVKNNVTLSKLRNYPSALEKALFSDSVPKEVYENLIATTKANIAPLHQYARIRKEKLGLEELHQYDLSVPIVQDVDQEISFEDAYATMLKALSPLGEEYTKILESFKDARYIDVRETPGKRSGAYNLGVYGVHPYVLLNHRDDLNSLFTLAHEMGHAMHSHFSHNTQPQITAKYSIFVAEVASTVNEVVLIHYLLDQEKNDEKMRQYLLNHFIDKFKGTMFTQVMFAEFEKITHEKAEKGEPLNAKVFSEIYENLFREYNGDCVELDDEVKYGWSRIPHFYRPFYVYKYATGFISAIHLADRIRKGDEETLSAYLEFLKSGSSEEPLELLKKTGVDLMSPEPIQNALKQFEKLVEELSKM